MATDETAPADAEHTVDIHFIKPTAFREVLCDGVIGGPTPDGKLWLAFYSERLPIPRIIRQPLKASEEGGVEPDYNQSAEVIESRRGIVRSVEFGAYLSVETAEGLLNFLGKHLKEIKSLEGK